MEPYDINAGRFYLRALHGQSTFDDTATFSALIPASPLQDLNDAESGWMEDKLYSWAVCEQTSPDLLALVTLDAAGEIKTYTPGSPDTLWEKNQDLGPVTLGQAAKVGYQTVAENAD
ncbi:hypothetical protein GP475_01220 [Corynebacterium poyangense]|uniref:Uncharacterized protein n=2 Tax=Corynebacterium poyangense TaxID=2684405 RepID=A0A7H0SLH5_9CORY|nr:hypothetical protein [Corynebacterium poyangense]QNQ89400.1 hypothetical protein GP475_01220 [Corynebacterium poyangense]